MKLTYQADFSLRVLLYLALRPERVATVAEIATAYGISAHHLSKVAQLLGRLGHVQLVRGQAGGLRLTAVPEELRLGDVVRQTEPSLALVECFEPKGNACPITPACSLKEILASARDAFLAVLDRYTLADAIRQRAQLEELLDLRPASSLVRGRSA